MFKEFFENETKTDSNRYKITYFYIAMLEAVENSVALATFSLIELESVLIGFAIAIGLIVVLLRLGTVKNIPLRITRPVAGILTSTAIPLILYGIGVSTPNSCTGSCYY